jgi:hypothetical protein
MLEGYCRKSVLDHRVWRLDENASGWYPFVYVVCGFLFPNCWVVWMYLQLHIFHKECWIISTFLILYIFAGLFCLEELVTQRALFFCWWVLSFCGVTLCICLGYFYAISILLSLAHDLMYYVTSNILFWTFLFYA